MFAFAVPLLALNFKPTSSLLQSFVCKSFPARISSPSLNPPLFSLLFYLPEILGNLPTVNIVIIHIWKTPVFKNKTQSFVVDGNRLFALRGHVTSFFMKMKVIWFFLQKTISGSYLKQNNGDLVCQTRTHVTVFTLKKITIAMTTINHTLFYLCAAMYMIIFISSS